jgi:hypothetical protein
MISILHGPAMVIKVLLHAIIDFNLSLAVYMDD